MFNHFARDFPNPSTVWGEIFYACLALAVAWLAAHAVKLAVHQAACRHGESASGKSEASFVANLLQTGIYLILEQAKKQFQQDGIEIPLPSMNIVVAPRAASESVPFSGPEGL